MTKRVVITGMGLVCPVGIGVQESWKAICAGASGVTRITRFDPSLYETQIAAEVKGTRIAPEARPWSRARRRF